MLKGNLCCHTADHGGRQVFYKKGDCLILHHMYVLYQYGRESEDKFANFQTNTDLCVPSDWLASARETYKEVSAFGRCA